jgi:hypothetical protein
MSGRAGEEVTADESPWRYFTGLGNDEQVAGAGSSDINDSAALGVEVSFFRFLDAEVGRLFPVELGQVHHPTLAVAIHAPRAAFRPLLPLALSVPDRDDGELEALCLVDGQDLDGFRSDGVRRIKLDRSPSRASRGRGVVVETFVRGELTR